MSIRFPRSRFPCFTIAIAGAAVAGHAIPGAAEALQFERAAVGAGEWWRWITAHLTHFDANHLGWDLGALLALGAVAERESRGRWLAALALAAIAITPAVWLWQPQFAVYRGLSGIDSALFGLVAGNFLRHAERPPRILGALALAGFGAKCVLELATHDTVFARGASYAPVPLAHLIGLLAGALCAFVPASARPRIHGPRRPLPISHRP